MIKQPVHNTVGTAGGRLFSAGSFLMVITAISGGQRNRALMIEVPVPRVTNSFLPPSSNKPEAYFVPYFDGTINAPIQGN